MGPCPAITRELAGQFAQVDSNDYANKNQNREHKKGECIQQTE